ATYLYAGFDKGMDEHDEFKGFQTLRYVVADGPGCSLARDMTWNGTGVVEATEAPAGFDPTGGVWVLEQGGSAFGGLARIYPGPRLSCTFDPAYASEVEVMSVKFDDTGTTAIAILELAVGELGYGKVTVSGSSCTVVPFPIRLHADTKYLVDG